MHVNSSAEKWPLYNGLRLAPRFVVSLALTDTHLDENEATMCLI